jgi:hypothetical protein
MIKQGGAVPYISPYGRWGRDGNWPEANKAIAQKIIVVIEFA